MANKKQRKQKRHERRLRQEQSRPKGGGTRRSVPWAGQTPGKPVPNEVVPRPPVWPEVHAATKNEIAVFQEIVQAAEDAFQRNYFSLENGSRQYDALHLLAYCCAYFVGHPAGVDPELSGGLDFHPYHLEILQAFSADAGTLTLGPSLGLEAERLLERDEHHWQAAIIRGLKANIDQIEGERKRNSVLSSMRTQTMAVRNQATHNTFKKIAHDLAETIREDFTSVHGVDQSDWWMLSSTCLKWLRPV